MHCISMMGNAPMHLVKNQPNLRLRAGSIVLMVVCVRASYLLLVHPCPPTCGKWNLQKRSVLNDMCRGLGKGSMAKRCYNPKRKIHTFALKFSLAAGLFEGTPGLQFTPSKIPDGHSRCINTHAKHHLPLQS